jgi:protein-S-isoprenylcysteine O-methyltransferase Ste14
MPPYEQPGSDVAFWVLFGLFALGEYVMQARSARNWLRKRSGARAERWSLLVVLAGVVGGLVGGVKLSEWQPGQITVGIWPLFVLGLVLMAAGVFIRQWAIFVLGRFFTPDVRVQPGQTVINRGPYRWVRHPSYTGMILVFVGIGLALTNWASLAMLAVVPTAALVVRIHAEERALLASLGEEYGRFAATRAHLLPGVW